MQGADPRRWTRRAFVGAAAAVVVAGGGPAQATPDSATSSVSSLISDLRSSITSSSNPSVRAVVLEELRANGSSSARSALEALADDRNDKVAIQAICSVGRSDHSGSRSKLRSIFEDTRRSDFARGAAFIEYARLQRADGNSWSDLASYASRHCSSTSRLGAIVAAAQGSSSSSGSR